MSRFLLTFNGPPSNSWSIIDTEPSPWLPATDPPSATLALCWSRDAAEMLLEAISAAHERGEVWSPVK